MGDSFHSGAAGCGCRFVVRGLIKKQNKTQILLNKGLEDTNE